MANMISELDELRAKIQSQPRPVLDADAVSTINRLRARNAILCNEIDRLLLQGPEGLTDDDRTRLQALSSEVRRFKSAFDNLLLTSVPLSPQVRQSIASWNSSANQGSGIIRPASGNPPSVGSSSATLAATMTISKPSGAMQLAEIHVNAVRDTLRQILSYSAFAWSDHLSLFFRFRCKHSGVDGQLSEDDDEFEQPSIVCCVPLVRAIRLNVIRTTCRSC